MNESRCDGTRLRLLRWQNVRRLRSSEILIAAYFVYVAMVAQFLIVSAWRAWVMAAGVLAVLALLTRANDHLRDWAPLAFTLMAFRQMDWFTRATNHSYERAWIAWDRLLLDQIQMRAMVERTGILLPGFLEVCYVLVYAVAPVALWALLANGRRAQMNRFWIAYLAGTLGAYALFPFFPSQPPRILFPGADMPLIVTPVRAFNLYLLGSYSIHSSVFPSAHVSSAFSAAWGLLFAIPQRRWIGWSMAAYAVCVSMATVYGRYHYAADVAAGFAMSFVGLAACFISYRGTE